ncbi:PAS domain-containing sensor histidine kinase [Priestia koreensis]|uniref:PAS domain-containing sensor histidine kinase n=1 Tax=Priestia koreensis TaxID=284581 RepID=UPI001F581049|nr:PAS domain-containing sensor histidine kinase [Priestia koreensis]UNL85856.1 PAS domain S-box protein [Priestia koreensis]
MTENKMATVKKGITEPSRLLSMDSFPSNEQVFNYKLYQDIFNQAVDGIIIFDEHGWILEVNPAFCNRTSYQREELLQMKIDGMVDEKFQYKIHKLLKILHKNGRARGELPVKLHNGEEKYFEFITTTHVEQHYYMSIMRDVTEKRYMEKQLAKSEQKFREVFENALDSIIIWEDNGRIVDANLAAARTFELPLYELIGTNLQRFTDTGKSDVSSIVKEFFDNGAIREELLFCMGNGQKKELEFTAKRGAIEGYNIAIFRNVSERKRMERDLRQNEQKFRKMFHGSLDGIVLWDEQKRVVDVNSAACNIFDQSIEELRGKKIWQFIHKNAFEELDSHWQTLDDSGEADGEILCVTMNNEEKIIEFSIKKDIMPGLYMTIIRDVTDKKQLQEQIRKSDTLQVVGQLAAGIAHEIRNPMTALKGFIQLLQDNINQENALYFDVITSELHRIETIITEFLVLAKPQAIRFEKYPVIKIVRETIDLLGAQALLEDVQFLPIFDYDLPPIYCESHQLKQVFINIIKNAIEAMKNGGFITIKVSRYDAGNILVSIKDEGEGIPPDRVKSLGEPFYTTKEKGTGLGLMVSYKIIKEHKGRIEVESELGAGTTFDIILPAVL